VKAKGGGKRSNSSHMWLQRQQRDLYTKKAKEAGFRSRSAFKLLEIQERDHLLHSGMMVVDLGAAPGGWSQVAKQLVGAKGYVLALDCLAMPLLAGVEFLQGDFTDSKVLDQVLGLLNGRQVDLVISDMAPNLSGMAAVDQPRAVYLADLALELAQKILKPSGSFLVKLFQGEGVTDYIAGVKQNFAEVYHRKPEASRSESRELYLVAKGFKG